jgi:hypothetical protein
LLDYRTFLTELQRLPGDIPMMLEHLPVEEYPLARQYMLRAMEAQVSILSLGNHKSFCSYLPNDPYPKNLWNPFA